MRLFKKTLVIWAKSAHDADSVSHDLIDFANEVNGDPQVAAYGLGEPQLITDPELDPDFDAKVSEIFSE